MNTTHTVKPPVVSLRDVFFSHDTGLALENISLDVQEGEILALIGPNGGGKTTLLRVILGILQPKSGSVHVLGQPPQKCLPAIGYVPQFSTVQPDFPASVLEMVLMGAARSTFFGGNWSTTRAAKEVALDYLETLGIADKASSPVHALSGGQRQRALVARALMGKPCNTDTPFLMLLDEPTANIDPQGKFCFYEFLGKLRGSITLIVVSHDLLMASPFFTSIAVVNRTLTLLPDAKLTPENLTVLFGSHMHECPVADIQHATGSTHQCGCSHPACAPEATGKF